MRVKELFGISIFLAGLGTATPGALAQDPPAFTEIARNPDGSVRTLDWLDATTYCDELGTRLPTPHEWALILQTRGSKIIETAYPGITLTEPEVMLETDQMAQIDYYAVLTRNADRNWAIDFYSHSLSYTPPTSADERLAFWTSFGIDRYSAYAASGNDGGFYRTHREESDGLAVRCIAPSQNKTN